MIDRGSSLKSDIQKMTEYLETDEKRHYEESEPSERKTHIWLSVKRLKTWLKHAEDGLGEVESELYGIMYFISEDYVTFIHNDDGSIKTFTSLDEADAAANAIDEREPDIDNLKTRVVSLDGIGY